MYKAYTPINIISVIVAGLLLATVPFLFYFYFALLILLFKIFIVICVIDFVRKTSFRKQTGLVLSLMFIAGIVSAVALYVLSLF